MRMWSPKTGLLLAALFLTWLVVEPRAAATLPDGFTETVVATGLASPTAMALAPDGRIFVAEQGGRLRVIKNDALLSTPFLTVTVSSVGERGLLGVALDPAFGSNHFLYVYYTATTPNVHNRVSRFTANGDVAAPQSEVILLELNPLSSATNHNGGAMHFGPDGKLYIAVGENANGSNSQTLNNLLGKILRINSDGTIPPNPFDATATGVNRSIWALGLRNPFTFAFQAGSGRMFINDVGQNTWEEINEGLAGANYGWPETEGRTTDPRFVSPLYAYAHSSGTPTGCAITGGAFYNPLAPQFPSDHYGNYFFADFCGGWINRLDLGGASPAFATFASGISSPVDLHVSADGFLYYLARGSGSTTGVVSRISFGAGGAPSITQQPASITVSEGQPATFSVAASGTAPLSYQWQRDGVDVPGATASSYTLASASSSDSGSQFRCIVSNGAGTVTSDSATLTVVGNVPPAPSIVSPAQGQLYSGGDTITYSGTATDAEDGPLPAAAFTWQVDFHHDTHVHPFIPPTTGSTSGTFTIPTIGETSANVWYRMLLTVTDSDDQSVTVFRDVLPRTARVTLSTSPTGLTLTLDGSPVITPFTFTGVVGIERTLSAPSPQMRNRTSYVFQSWSDAGSQTHTISTPPIDTTVTAKYRNGKGKP